MNPIVVRIRTTSKIKLLSFMTDYLGAQPSLDDYWRGIILFGQNVASYKFALAKSLLELAPTGKTLIHLEELAEPFSRHIAEHLKIEDKQTTSLSSRFLDACRLFNEGKISKQKLIDTTVKLGFENVIDAFHVVNRNEIPNRFFTDERQSSHKGIILTDDLFTLMDSYQWQNLSNEVEARWRLVETAWKLKVSKNLISISYDADSEQFFNTVYPRRVSLISCRDALNGYQKGKCFYCFNDISIKEIDNLADVDHFFPRVLMFYKIANPVDGVWNLVLACQLCNRGPGGKFEQLANYKFLKRLHKRNEFFINSHHPLRETLITQTGQNEQTRVKFLHSNYQEALTTKLLNSSWKPVYQYKATF